MTYLSVYGLVLEAHCQPYINVKYKSQRQFLDVHQIAIGLFDRMNGLPLCYAVGVVWKSENIPEYNLCNAWDTMQRISCNL